jgi:hypothetical protein
MPPKAFQGKLYQPADEEAKLPELRLHDPRKEAEHLARAIINALRIRLMSPDEAVNAIVALVMEDK